MRAILEPVRKRRARALRPIGQPILTSAVMSVGIPSMISRRTAISRSTATRAPH